MAKRHELGTRAFGAEPVLPDTAGLAEWIAEHRGTMADITTYLLDQSLAPQIGARIGIPCAGGSFYGARLKQCLAGLEGDRAAGEIHGESPALIEDAAGIVVQKKGAWCAMPAPHRLGLADDFYHDADEWSLALNQAFRTMMRAMRDTGIAGHVLIADRIVEDELASLARQKVFFFVPSPDRENLASLMEYQRQVAIPSDRLEILLGLMNEYQVSHVFLTNPDPAAIRHALDRLDPEQISAGGYCTGDSGQYWKDLVSRAWYER